MEQWNVVWLSLQGERSLLMQHSMKLTVGVQLFLIEKC